MAAPVFEILYCYGTNISVDGIVWCSNSALQLFRIVSELTASQRHQETFYNVITHISVTYLFSESSSFRKLSLIDILSVVSNMIACIYDYIIV